MSKFRKDARVVISRQPQWATSSLEQNDLNQRLKPDIGRKGVIMSPEIQPGQVVFHEDGALNPLILDEDDLQDEASWTSTQPR